MAAPGRTWFKVAPKRPFGFEPHLPTLILRGRAERSVSKDNWRLRSRPR